MNASKFFLKAANSLVTAIVALFLILAAAYSGYALWDNAHVYGAVDDIQFQLLKLKPDPEQKDGGTSFEELRKINPDVCGWITLDHTKIDYPILQGEDNLTYINTDVYGDFALSGSIFLDSGCDRNFRGKYSLLYGHHMAEHKMFGDLDLYRKKKFFDKNTTGTLILPDRSYKLEIFACMQVSASEDSIFATGKWQADTSGLVDFVRKNAEHVHQQTMDNIGKSEDFSQILAMSTCSSEFTDARTVLLAVMKPYSPET